MLMNGLTPVLVIFILCSLKDALSESSEITGTGRGEISTRNQKHEEDRSKTSYAELKNENEKEERLDSEAFGKNNFQGKKDATHEDGRTEEAEKNHPVKILKRKENANTERKHHTQQRTRIVSDKTIQKKLNDLITLIKAKAEYNAKHQNNGATDTSRNDKKLKDKHGLNKEKKLPVSDKANSNEESLKEKSDERKDSKKHRKQTGKFADSKSQKVKSHKKHRKGNDRFADSKPKKIKSPKKHGHSKIISKKKLKSLREALLIHPFAVWKFKDRYRSMVDLGIHETLLHDVVENKGNTRLKHKLFKVFKGEDLHLAVIGGSNTAGGGLQEDEGRTDGIFFRVISDWWRKTITPITGSRFKTRQIAMGGTGSDFFQYCHHSYVQDNVDLVLLEMSVNDLHELPYNVNLSLPIEQLTRQLLEYPTEPALLYVNLLSGRSYYQGCTNLEDFGQRLLSDVYKVTTFSWRDAVCPIVGGRYRAPLKSCTVVCKDGHHINQLGHAHISLMVINLFRDLLLGSIGHVRELSRQVFHDEVILPKPVFIKKQSKIITQPICWTTVTPNFKRKIITNSMEVGVMENYGFEFLHDKAIGGRCVTEKACRADAYSGWTGQDVGARLTLSFTIPPLDRKRSVTSRSVVFATRTCSKCGIAEVWLDDDVMNRKYVRAKSIYAQTWSQIVGLRVDPGDHTMSVKVVQPGFITVVGVMLGPPDGPY